MPDCRPGHGTPIDVEKIRSLQVMGGVVRAATRPLEGRHHPETCVPWPPHRPAAASLTEHATRDDRVDAVARVATVRAVRNPTTGRVTNA
jgi:hypothetical protein